MMKRGSRGRGAKSSGSGSSGGGGLLGTSSFSTGTKSSSALSVSRSFIRYLLLAVAACSFVTTFVLLKPNTLYDVGATKEYFSPSVLGEFGREVESAGARDVALIEEDDTDSFLSIPEVTTIAPFHSPAAGGDQIVIHGHNLRSRTGEALVTAAVGKKNCTETRPSLTDARALVCVVPPGLGTKLSVTVTVSHGDGTLVTSKGNTLFSYDGPEVVGVAPDRAPTSGGIVVTVRGRNFGPAGDPTPMEVLIGSAPCQNPERVSDSTVTCLLLPGTEDPAGKVVSVHVGSMSSNEKNIVFRYYLTPAERLAREAEGLLDGLTVLVGGSGVAVASHAGLFHARDHPSEAVHKDLFTGRTHLYSVAPDVLAALPSQDPLPIHRGHERCAVVGNARSLLKFAHGADIDRADVVVRLNNAPTEGFETHVGSKTTYRMSQTRFLRSMWMKTPADRGKLWRPTAGTALVIWSEYAQDFYVQLQRAFQTVPMIYLSRAFVGNMRTLYSELSQRFRELGITRNTPGLARNSAETGISTATARRLTEDMELETIWAEEAAKSGARFVESGSVVEPMNVGEPFPEFYAVMFAAQLCRNVDLYGFRPFFSNDADEEDIIVPTEVSNNNNNNGTVGEAALSRVLLQDDAVEDTGVEDDAEVLDAEDNNNNNEEEDNNGAADAGEAVTETAVDAEGEDAAAGVQDAGVAREDEPYFERSNGAGVYVDARERSRTDQLRDEGIDYDAAIMQLLAMKGFITIK